MTIHLNQTKETHANQLGKRHTHQSTHRECHGVTGWEQLKQETLNRGQTSCPPATLRLFSARNRVCAKGTFDSPHCSWNGFPLIESVGWTINQKSWKPFWCYMRPSSEQHDNADDAKSNHLGSSTAGVSRIIGLWAS
jgi:hypothetical protein